jgi:TATA-box binding protein (TBP) (component of TFIID and TFIIIB)
MIVDSIVRDMQDRIDALLTTDAPASAKTLANAKPTPLSISLITVMFYTNLKCECLLRKVQANQDDPKVVSHAAESMPVGFEVKPMLIKDMMNCLMFKWPLDPSSKKKRRPHRVLKLFNNGKIQVNGAKTTAEALANARMLCSLLEVVLAQTAGSVVIVDFNLQMMNANFGFDRALNLDNVKPLLPVMHVMPTLEKKQHNALRFKLCMSEGAPVTRGIKTSSVSVFVFASGKIILSGAKEPCHVLRAFDTLTKLLDANYETVVTDSYVSVRDMLAAKRAASREDGGAPKKRSRGAACDEMDFGDFFRAL